MEHLQLEVEHEAERGKQALAAREAQIRTMREQMAALKKRLEGAQAAVVDALNAKTKDDALGVAVRAIATSLPYGTASYIAELRTAADVDNEDPAAALVAETQAAMAAVGEDSGEGPALPPALAMMKGVTPGLMTSPLAAVVGGGLGEGGATPGGSRPSSRPTSAAIASAGYSEVKETLVWKYIKASPDHGFMVGQKLAWGAGVSWALVEKGGDVHVPNVGATPGVWFFRGRNALGGEPAGGYFAAPIVGNSGEVIGLMAVDTMAAAAAAPSAAASAAEGAGGVMSALSATASHASSAGALDAADLLFVRGLAGAIAARARTDQDAFSEAMLAMALAAADDVPEPPAAPVDPEQFVPQGEGLSGGLKLFADALDILRGLSDEELEALRNLDNPDEATLAVIKSVLAAVGEATGAEDWAHARQHITRELLDRLLGLDPQQAWAEWQALCK